MVHVHFLSTAKVIEISLGTFSPASTSRALRMAEGTGQAACFRHAAPFLYTGLSRSLRNTSLIVSSGISVPSFDTIRHSEVMVTEKFLFSFFLTTTVARNPHAPGFMITFVAISVSAQLPLYRCSSRRILLFEQLLEIGELVLHVRNMHCLHEFLLKGRVSGYFNKLDPPRAIIGFFTFFLVEEGHSRAVSCGVSDHHHFIDRDVREHAQGQGRLPVNMASKGACKFDPVECLITHLLHHEFCPRVKGPFGKLKRAD